MSTITELNAPRVDKRRQKTAGRDVVAHIPSKCDRYGVTRISLSLDKDMFSCLLDRAIDDRVSVAEVIRRILTEAL